MTEKQMVKRREFVDSFRTTELAEFVFNGLIGAYSRISTKEFFKGDKADQALVEKFKNKSSEYWSMKEKTIKLPFPEQDEIIERLAPELKRILEYEQSNYRSTTTSTQTL